MSFTFKIELSGLDIEKDLRKKQKTFIAFYKILLAKFADDLQKAVKRDMKYGAKSGRLYPKSDGSSFYKASAPGETPAVDTGNLYRSVKVRSSNMGMKKVVTTGTDYVGDLMKMNRIFFEDEYNKRVRKFRAQVRKGGFA